MIDACQRGPEAVAAGIARALVYFDDPRAQSAVDTYLPQDLANAFREGEGARNQVLKRWNAWPNLGSVSHRPPQQP